MGSNRRIEGLPNLPGNSFVDPTRCDFRRSQTFDFVNGFRVPKPNYLGIGSVPIEAKNLTMKDIFQLYNYDPSLTYGKPRPKPPPAVVPAFVALEKKTLRFYGFFKETVNDSPDENYRVRPVEILYYLEDDSMMVVEPKIENSGLMQGKFLNRHRIPKNNLGETYHWKDLNLKCDMLFYRRAFRICDADRWTKEFYEAEGLILNDAELIPKDPFTDKRYLTLQKRTFTSPSVNCNRKKKQTEYEKKGLPFKSIWEDEEDVTRRRQEEILKFSAAANGRPDFC